MNSNLNGNMGVSIKSILKTFKTEISFMQPIFEAIANSFEAGAKNIEIVFHKNDNLFDFNYVKSIDVIDDGVGFDTDNLNSFNEYMSDYKISLGCKGIGRFTWLKIFNDVYIESFTNDEHIKIVFSQLFNKDKDISVEPKINSSIGTKVTFKNIISSKNTEIEIDLKKFKDTILDYFMLKFIEMKNNSINYKITIKFENEQVFITSKDIGAVKTENFKIKADEIEYKFKINYSFSENTHQTKNECYLCGNGRIVEKFDLKKIFSSLPESKYIKVLIYSSYFDERVNNERTAFTFSKTENNPSITDPIPFSKIYEKIENKLDEIILKEFPNIMDDNEKIIAECIDEKPYLNKYIMEDVSLIKRKNDLLLKAQKQFEKEKEEVSKNFIKILEEKSIDPDILVSEFEKLNDLSNRELAQYFLFRQSIIDSLKKMNDDNEKIEKYLHALFVTMGKGFINSDSLNKKYTNCIWLLDDKFMSYERLYSDVKIDTIKKQITSESADYHGGIEPDLTIFYSNHDIVVVEFKAIGASIDEKLKAYTEISRNMGIIAKNFDDVNNIYGYIITKFDDKFKDYISTIAGVKTFFSTGTEPVYYVYNDNIKDKNQKNIICHIYIVSTDSIYYDANSRNKMFIDIIKNNH